MTEQKKPKKGTSEAREALKRLADLTRKIVQVPKSDLPTDARKQSEGSHNS